MVFEIKGHVNVATPMVALPTGARLQIYNSRSPGQFSHVFGELSLETDCHWSCGPRRFDDLLWWTEVVQIMPRQRSAQTPFALWVLRWIVESQGRFFLMFV